MTVFAYEHIAASRRHLVDADNETRTRAIYEDVWVEYPTATKVLAYIKYMLRMPHKAQAPCLLIHSQPGMGKSALFEKIKQLYGLSSAGGPCVASMTVLAKHVSGHKIFCNDLVSTLSGGIYATTNVDDGKLVTAILSRNIRAIAIDELNDLLLANRLDQARNLKYLKELSGSPFCLIVIAVGTHDCHDALKSDKQLARRFNKIELKPWTDQDLLRSFVTAYVSTFPLKYPSALEKKAFMKYLMDNTDGVLDSIVKYLCNAACWAIVDGYEKIDLEILKKSGEPPV